MEKQKSNMNGQILLSNVRSKDGEAVRPRCMSYSAVSGQAILLNIEKEREQAGYMRICTVLKTSQ